jgi:hypothetical protein
MLVADAKAFAQEFASRCGRISIRTRREGGRVYGLMSAGGVIAHHSG